MKKHFIAVILLALAVLPCGGQQVKKALVWIDPANPDSAYLEAAVQKKNVPVQFTTEKDKAQYVAILTETETKIRGTVFGEDSRDIGRPSIIVLSLSVFEISSGDVVYTCTCAIRASGHQRAAECLAKHWAASIQKGKK